jgi:hypothetical protein
VDPDRATACLEAIEGEVAHGRSTSLVDVDCSALVVEPVGLGERCVGGLDCLGGACLGGVCVAEAAVGEPCDERECADGLDCVASLCEAPVPSGGACDEESVCAELGEICVGGVCAPIERTRCTWDEECGSGRRCDDEICVAGLPTCVSGDECGVDRTCVGERADRCVVPVGVGWECRSERDCPFPMPCADGRCATRGLPGGAAHMARCVLDDDCGPGLACGSIVLEGRCRPDVCRPAHVFTERSYVEDCH